MIEEQTMLTKQEAKELKELFSDDEKAFFEKMEDLLEYDNAALNGLLNKKDKLKKIKKDLKDESITREQNDVDFAKIQKYLFELIDERIDNNAYSSQGQDAHYSNLCNLDFKHQVKYFSDLIKSSKPLIPFIIRANKENGQQWLIHQLIYTYQIEKSKNIMHPVTIDFSELKINDTDAFFENLHGKFGLSKYDSNLPFEKKEKSLRASISKKLQASSLFFIFRNAFNFVHSEEFNIFFNSFNYVYNELTMEEITHKCIFFFVEEKPEPYNCDNYCLFSSRINSFKAKKIENFRLIDLDNISKLTINCIEVWLGSLDESICNGIELEDFEEIIEQTDGNPEKIIPILCEKVLKIEYQNYHSKWLKY